MTDFHYYGDGGSFAGKDKGRASHNPEEVRLINFRDGFLQEHVVGMKWSGEHYSSASWMVCAVADLVDLEEPWDEKVDGPVREPKSGTRDVERRDLDDS